MTTLTTEFDKLYQFSTYNNVTAVQTNLFYLKLSQITSASSFFWVGILNPIEKDFGTVYTNPSNLYSLKTFRADALGVIIFQGT